MSEDRRLTFTATPKSPGPADSAAKPSLPKHRTAAGASEADVYICAGPYPNPVWLRADDDKQHLHDKWAYDINGRRFTHPTFAGAKKMMNRPQDHAEVLDYWRGVDVRE